VPQSSAPPAVLSLDPATANYFGWHQ